jgi:DNA-binding IclR family transcriptional regulator
MNESVLKAIALLEHMARLRKSVALKDLARSTKLDKATAFRLLSSLRKKNLVQQTNEQRFYSLGPGFLAFADAYRRDFTRRELVLPYLEKLVEATGETAIYCERFQHDSCVTVDRHESPHQTRTVIETGVVRPLVIGSSALAILAALPKDEIRDLLKVKPNGPMSRSAAARIWQKVDEIKRLGYAVSVKERYAFTAGIAASCLFSEAVLGSIAVIGPSERIEAFGIEKAGSIVGKIARQISAMSGNPSSVKITSRPLEVGK